MTPASVLWLALVAVEVAAVVLAWHAARTVRPDATTDARSSADKTRSGACETGSPEVSRRAAGLPAFVGSRALLCLLAFALLDELAVLGLHAILAHAPRPIAGWWRVPYHVETAFVLGWPCLLAAVCWQAKAPRSVVLAGLENGKARSLSSGGTDARAGVDQDGARRPFVNGLLGAYLGALGGLIAAYPIDAPGSGAPRLRWIFLAWEVLCVVVAWWGLWRARLRPWGPVERCLVVLVSCETMVATVGPFASDPFTRWWVGACFYLAAWGGMIGVLIKRHR